MSRPVLVILSSMFELYVTNARWIIFEYVLYLQIDELLLGSNSEDETNDKGLTVLHVYLNLLLWLIGK